MSNVELNTIGKPRLKQQKYLLFALVLFMALPILITFFPLRLKLLFAITYSLLVAGGIHSVADNRQHLGIGIGLGVISFVGVWANYMINDNVLVDWLKNLSLLVFFLFIAYRIFKIIATHQTVNLEIIYASISGFLLLGIIGGLSFQALEMSHPNSFKLLMTNGSLFDLHYLSFVTLTSLGYGDVTPLTQAGKTMTIILSVAGQLYLTILIAILIGKYLAKEGTRTRE